MPVTFGIELNKLQQDAIKQQQQLFKKALQNPSLDKLTCFHVQDLSDRITAAFHAEQQSVK